MIGFCHNDLQVRNLERFGTTSLLAASAPSLDGCQLPLSGALACLGCGQCMAWSSCCRGWWAPDTLRLLLSSTVTCSCTLLPHAPYLAATLLAAVPRLLAGARHPRLYMPHMPFGAAHRAPTTLRILGEGPQMVTRQAACVAAHQWGGREPCGVHRPQEARGNPPCGACLAAHPLWASSAACSGASGAGPRSWALTSKNTHITCRCF